MKVLLEKLKTNSEQMERALFSATERIENGAMRERVRYSLLGGGKRIRSFLMREAFSLFEKDAETITPFLSAIECIHTYSLIHDDLPCMDNDDLRRGKPTSHKVFGEAEAVLSGDALLNLAFELMLDDIRSERERKAAALLARKAGASGMIAGQAEDIACEKEKSTSKERLSYVQRHKTADLIEGAILVGAILGGASEQELEILSKFGQKLGVLFQVTDDILDVTGGKDLGKTTGKDEKEGKLTSVSLLGLRGAIALADGLLQELQEILLPFGERAKTFSSFVTFVRERTF